MAEPPLHPRPPAARSQFGPGPPRIGQKSLEAEGAPLVVGGPSGPMPSARVAASHWKQKHRG
ncbi:DUF6053 domain-containing protein [Lysobacter yananisis]